MSKAVTTENTKGTSEKISEKVVGISSVKANADVVNFYQFVYDNKLRKEAKLALDAVAKILRPKKKTRRRRTKKQ